MHIDQYIDEFWLACAMYLDDAQADWYSGAAYLVPYWRPGPLTDSGNMTMLVIDVSKRLQANVTMTHDEAIICSREGKPEAVARLKIDAALTSINNKDGVAA